MRNAVAVDKLIFVIQLTLSEHCLAVPTRPEKLASPLLCTYPKAVLAVVVVRMPTSCNKKALQHSPTLRQLLLLPSSASPLSVEEFEPFSASEALAEQRLIWRSTTGRHQLALPLLQLSQTSQRPFLVALERAL
mmetsp:Transcript_17315/g.41405  ORF Transcript_17315/g.41405 Transcript_17315/m.41405 type:complete len:134 (+) Transcript_17315:231-632(+)